MVRFRAPLQISWFTLSREVCSLSRSQSFWSVWPGLSEELGISAALPVYDFGVDEKHLSSSTTGADVSTMSPDGSFANDPQRPLCPYHRLQAITAFHNADISVIMDVVYNHVLVLNKLLFLKNSAGYFSDSNMGYRTNILRQ